MVMMDLFKQDGNGMAVPELNPGAEWVMLADNVLMTMKLDGIAIRVTWDSTKVRWDLKQVAKTGEYTLDRSYAEDEHIWKAFDAQVVKKEGMFICYGAYVNGNPHNLSKTFFIQMNPISWALVVDKNYTIVPLRDSQVTVEQFYAAIKKELQDSPEIEGLVFHLENTNPCRSDKMAVVTKRHMGIQWPSVKNAILGL